MTDISKYKNVSLAKDTYNNLDRIRKVITPHITIPNKSVEELDKSITVSCTMCESQGELDDPNYTIIIDADGAHRLQ